MMETYVVLREGGTSGMDWAFAREAKDFHGAIDEVGFNTPEPEETLYVLEIKDTWRLEAVTIWEERN